MDLVELTCTVNKSGTLKIPNVILHEMGLLAGDSVRLAFLSNGTGQNIFQEFMITPNGVDGVAQTDIISEIAIPNELLSVANIASGSQLQIACVNGAIVIYQPAVRLLEDLEELLCKLGIAADAIQELSQQ